MKLTMKTRQSGIALISILLIVAMATVIAVSMAREQHASVLATRSFLDRGQALQYALGGEELARQILFEDFAEGTGIDHAAETWANPELHFEFEDGEVNLKITDMQGLFNLNSLSDENGKQSISRQRFNNLAAAANVDLAIVDRLHDWLDADSSNRPAGAEDFDYLALDPPYRAGNSILFDVSELRLIGMPAGMYQALLPDITALPNVGSALNVNTATPGVMQSLAPGVSYPIAETLVQRSIEEEGFETVEEFLQLPELAGLGIATEGLSVQSSFFEVRIIARYQDRFSYLTSLVHRQSTDGYMRVIQRDFSRNFRPSGNQGAEQIEDSENSG